MNAGKTTMLLASAHNYKEKGMKVVLLTSGLDTRSDIGVISSRIGISSEAYAFHREENLLDYLTTQNALNTISCVFVDEAQFLQPEQVWQLAEFTDSVNIPVCCYGLRVDFKGDTFPGSNTLLGISDELVCVPTTCYCGKRATMVIRLNQGSIVNQGEQIQIGGENMYQTYCRKHWKDRRRNSE
jgi:thymidine kinase